MRNLKDIEKETQRYNRISFMLLIVLCVLLAIQFIALAYKLFKILPAINS